jgi:MFS family permease
MIARFSVYGFLKNQQYYVPFIILAFREYGLSFTVIGLLIGFRELAVNVMEVPTGVVADLAGRRRSMILAFVAYIISFVVFGWVLVFAPSGLAGVLFVSMFFFAIGEAFRTGTHKAMILDWLRLEGRQGEKTRTYGVTRSWARAGSALAAIIATGLLLLLRRGEQPQYGMVFFFCIPPYLLGIVNFLGYPKELDGRPEDPPTLRNVVRQLLAAFAQAFRRRRLRRVLAESMGYKGMNKVAAEYIQPVLKQLALGMPVLLALSDADRTTVLAGAVYLILAILSIVGSRKSAAVAERCGGEHRAARMLWAVTFVIYIPVAAALGAEVFWLGAVGLLVLEVLYNFWRPISLTRIDDETDDRMGATMLSIESQGQALVAMVVAPVVGALVDTFAPAPGQPALWVVAVFGAAVALIGALVPTMQPDDADSPSGREQGGPV